MLVAVLASSLPALAVAASCPVDPGYGAVPPRVVVADGQTGAMGSFAAHVDLAGRPWIAAVGDGFFPGASTSQLVVARLRADGRRDPAFGTGGVAIVQLPSTSGIFGGALAIAPNGDGVIAWNVLEGGPPSIVLARFTPQGTLRAGFGEGGLVRLSCASGDQGQRFASGIVVDALDRTLVALTDRGPTGARGFVARLGQDGAPDAGFGTAGCVDVATATGGMLVGTPSAIAIDGFGRLVVAVLAASTTQVLMLTDAGAADPGFGSAGFAPTPLGRASFSPRMAAAPGGRLLVAQTTVLFDGAGQRAAFEVAALLPTGSPDPAFDDDGAIRFVLPAGDAFNDNLRDILVSPLGDIVLVGQASGRIAVLRIADDGTPDARDCDAFATYEAGLGAAVRSVAVGGASRDGRIVVLGHAGAAMGSSLGDLVAFAVRPGLLFVDGFEPASP